MEELTVLERMGDENVHYACSCHPAKQLQQQQKPCITYGTSYRTGTKFYQKKNPPNTHPGMNKPEKLEPTKINKAHNDEMTPLFKLRKWSYNTSATPSNAPMAAKPAYRPFSVAPLRVTVVFKSISGLGLEVGPESGVTVIVTMGGPGGAVEEGRCCLGVDETAVRFVDGTGNWGGHVGKASRVPLHVCP